MSGLEHTAARYHPTRPSLHATVREFFAFALTPAALRSAGQEPGMTEAASHGAVLVIPTQLRSDRQTRGLRAAIAQQGYAVFGWELGHNWGPTPKLMAGVDARLLELSATHGPVNLVGLSMGGLFARWLAFRHPDRVRQVITVGSPFRAPFDSFFLPLRPLLTIWPVPDLADLAAVLERPLSVPETCIHSTGDGIVAEESCHDPQRPQDSFVIDCPHVLIAEDPAVRAIVLERLGRALA